MRRLFLLLACALVAGTAPAQAYRFEAEGGTIVTAGANTRVRANGAASGSAYVGNFPNQDAVVDQLTVGAALPAGLYDLYIGYRSPFDTKAYSLTVGGESGSGAFARSSDFRPHFGGQFYVDAPTIDLVLREGWGYYDVDYFEFQTAAVREPLPVAPTLSNPNASGSAQYLMRYLTEGYGSQTLLGQQREFSTPAAIHTPGVINHYGGVLPAITGSDLIKYSPSRVARGENPNGESERLIGWAQQTGGAVSLMWHWNAPAGLIDQPGREWWRGFYSNATTFDLGAALANPASPEYGLLLRDIDAISGELKKFRDAGVPVLWRPLHEAQGNDSGAWFWWGDSGPDALKGLWRLMHDRMTNVHGLDNLIWASTVQVDATNWQEWYPGDDVVDVVGVDIYSDDPNDTMSAQWIELLDEFDGRKVIALTETGSLPPAEVLERYGVAFRYVLPWNETFLTDDQSAAEVQQIVSDTDVTVLDELPVTPWRRLGAVSPGDFNGDGRVDAADLAVWRDHFGLSASAPSDGNGDGRVDAADYTVWRDHASSVVATPEPAGVALAVVATTLASRRFRRPLG